MSFTGLFSSLKEKQSTPVPKNPIPSRQKRSKPQQSRVPGARKRSRPTPEVLALSAELKQLISKKRIDQALEVYRQSHLRDEHHAGIVVDGCARSGRVDEAVAIVDEFRAPSVELQTALVKVFCHAGRLHDAEALFVKMCADNRCRRPNVRTLNTLLRGCLWTAASERHGRLAGGVVTSERAWSLFHDRVGEQHLDTSSYEYAIALLCHALDTSAAMERLQMLQKRSNVTIKGTAKIDGGDYDVLETMAVAYLALGRACALQGQADEMWNACQRALAAVKGAREHASSNTIKEDQMSGGRGTQGGKRSWKRSGGGDVREGRRADSNLAFRDHRLSEIEMDVRKLLKARGKGCTSLSFEELSRRLWTKLLLFSGGGCTTVTEPPQPVEFVNRQLNVATMESYGGSKLSVDDRVDCLLRTDGTIDFDTLFGRTGHELEVELGAGFGDWIAMQAQRHPERNYVAVELRADRVYQVFLKSTIETTTPLVNVCSVGSEASAFLSERVLQGTVSTVFVHHPEPPSQTFGEDRADLESIRIGGQEPAHMLNSNTIFAAARCLKTDGKIAIVTDNRWYAKLLGATFARVVVQNRGLLRQATSLELQGTGLRRSESFGEGIVLYEAQPMSSSGRNEDCGVTWFDRLWRTGAGSHAERKTRYVFVLYRST